MSIIIIFFIGMMYDADIIGMILAKKDIIHKFLDNTSSNIHTGLGVSP